MYQDFKQEGQEGVCRWWFKDLKTWHSYEERLEIKKFVAIAPLKPI